MTATATPSAPVLANHEPAPDTHFVFAVDYQHRKFRVSDPLTWAAAQAEWLRLDDARREDWPRWQHVKFFAVRSSSDPDWKRAPLSLVYSRPVLPTRGHKHPADAARKAWKVAYPTYRSNWDRSGSDPNARTGTQGLGGWYYWPNGRTACQGASGQYGLAGLCQRRGMVVQGRNDRWYVVDLAEAA